jgi:hypothetical protein
MGITIPEDRPAWRRAWAPLLAGVFAAALYWPRVDSVFYFLHGAQGQGLLLSRALADGLGFVDLSLPGHPAHVREPPFFYLMLAVIIKTFGFKMYPLKVLIWSGYVGTAVLGTMLFQRRTSAWIAFLGMALCMSGTILFWFFTGPLSDVPFTAVSLAALLLLERLAERVSGSGAVTSRVSLWPIAGGAVALTLSAVFIRSLGLALVLAGCGALLAHQWKIVDLRRRSAWVLLILLPVVIGQGAWAIRGVYLENPAGYNYLDWFMMDLVPDSPEMTAVDFHAPLMGELNRITVPGLLHRTLRHTWIYAFMIVNGLVDKGIYSPLERLISVTGTVIGLCFLFFILAGAYLSERGRRPTVIFYIVIYMGAVLVWPMDDYRLLLPLLPFAAFYAVHGFFRMTGATLMRLKKGSPDKEAAPDPPLIRLVRVIVPLALLIPIIGFNVYININYHQSCSGLPTVSLYPGFEVRFMHKETMDSFRLLMWARDNTEPGATLMYHSPPPCGLVTGRQCSPIPFSRDTARVREYIVDGGADYLVLDQWGEIFPSGPGWFVENILRPTADSSPEDFRTVYEIPGTRAMVVKVVRGPG